MDEKNLTLFSLEELPQTDEPEKKESLNNLQENLIFLMNKAGVSLADIQKETLIPWGTLYGWYKKDVNVQHLDINIKELANYFNVSIEDLGFADMAKDFENFINNGFVNK